MVPISAHALFARPLVVAPDVGAGRRGARPAPTAPACCGATAAGRSTCRPGPGSRCAAARTPVRLVRLHEAPFTDRLVAKFDLPVDGWRGAAERRRRRDRRRRCAPCSRRCGSARSGVIDEAVLELGPGSPSITGETGAGKTMVVTASACCSAAGPTPAPVRTGAAPRAGRGRGCASAPAGARRGASTRPAARSRTTGVLLARKVSAEGRSRAFVGGASVPGRRCWPSWPSRWSRCTASPTSTGCCARRPSATRSTASRGEPAPALLAGYARAYTPAARPSSASSPRSSAQRPRAGPGGRPAAVRPRRDRGGRPAARRGRRARRRGAAARVRRRPAHGRRAGARGAVRRRAATPTRWRAVAAARTAARRRARARPGGRPRWPTGWPRSATCSPTWPPTSRRTPPALETDPARLAAVSERRAALTALTRKYGETVDEVLAWAEHVRRAAARARRHRRPDRRARAPSARPAARRARRRRGRRSSDGADARRPRALGDAVTAELAVAGDAARPARASRCTQRDDRRRAGGRRRARCGSAPTGVDEVELLLAANRGRRAAAARQGRLRRRAVPGDAGARGRRWPAPSPVPTFVFDEVDAGVGGKAAVEVGRRLARLAAAAQVWWSPTCRRSRRSPTGTSWSSRRATAR